MNLERTRSVPRMWRKALASARCPNHGSPTEIFVVYYNVEKTNKVKAPKTLATPFKPSMKFHELQVTTMPITLKIIALIFTDIIVLT